MISFSCAPAAFAVGVRHCNGKARRCHLRPAHFKGRTPAIFNPPAIAAEKGNTNDP